MRDQFIVKWMCVILASLTGSMARAELMYNRSRYDVFVAFGTSRDNSIAGIGDNGYTDPNAGLYSTFWTRLPAGESVEIPRDYAGYARVVAIVNGHHEVISPARAMAMCYFPLKLDESAGGSGYTRCSTGDQNYAQQAIRKAGFQPKYFFPLAAYRYSNNGPVEVLAGEDTREDLERRLGFRQLSVVGLVNETNLEINFSFRWTPESPWSPSTIATHGRLIWASGYNPVRPEIAFNEGINVGGNQTRVTAVRPFDVKVNGGQAKPTFEQVSQYQFVANGNRLQLSER